MEGFLLGKPAVAHGGIDDYKNDSSIERLAFDKVRCHTAAPV